MNVSTLAVPLVIGLAAFTLGGCDELEERLNQKKLFGPAYVLDRPNASDSRPVGWTMVGNSRMGGENLSALVRAGVQVRKGSMSLVTETREVWQVLGPDKLRLTVQRDRNARKANITGMPPQDEQVKGALVGQYVIFERRKGKWSGHLESGRRPTSEQRELIAARAKALDDESHYYGTEGRQVGEEWTENVSNTPNWKSGTINYHFERIEEFDGLLCAYLTGSVEGILGVAQAGADGEATMVGTFKIHRSLDHLEDIHAELEGTMTLTGSPQAGVSIEVSGPIRMESLAEIRIPYAAGAGLWTP